MIKIYCDRCGRETRCTGKIRIPTKKTIGGFETEEKDVCNDCGREYDEIISQLTDIRFVLFKSFMEKKAKVTDGEPDCR